MNKYRWVWQDKTKSTKFYNVGILDDGTLHNPNGYPDDIVRAAVLAANQRWHERRSEAAKKAAETRARRLEKKVYAVAKRWLEGHDFGPNQHCQICGKSVTDQESIQRGIDSDCWQRVLRAITAIRTKQNEAA